MVAWWSSGLDYLQRIWRYRYFWASLVRHDLRTRYRNSILGIGWSLARPLAMTIIFCLVFGKLFNLEMTTYAPFLLLGMTLWQLLLESVLLSCQCMNNGGPYIKQQPLPLAIFPIRHVAGSAVHCLIALALSIAVTAWFKGVSLGIALLGILPGMAIMVLLCIFLATLCGMLNTLFPDSQHILDIALQILFYLTPVLYPPGALSNRGRFSWVVELNPLTSVFELVRSPILNGTFPSLHCYQISLLFLLITGVAAVLALRRLERTLVFWI